jgi:hypothetical protein
MIVMTQSCDLVVRGGGSCAVSEAALCPVYFRHDLRDHPIFRKSEGWNNAKKGRLPAFHVLNRCEIEGHELDFMVVDLGRVAGLSVAILREFAAAQGERVRLLPPYREHLAQAFARFFMRVGLPVDIPDFK